MKRYIVARYAGDEDPYYVKGKHYPLAIKTRLFSRRVTIYKTRGYLNQPCPGSQREFRNIRSFLSLFKPVPGDRVWQD